MPVTRNKASGNAKTTRTTPKTRGVRRTQIPLRVLCRRSLVASKSPRTAVRRSRPARVRAARSSNSGLPGDASPPLGPCREARRRGRASRRGCCRARGGSRRRQRRPWHRAQRPRCLRAARGPRGASRRPPRGEPPRWAWRTGRRAVPGTAAGPALPHRGPRRRRRRRGWPRACRQPRAARPRRPRPVAARGARPCRAPRAPDRAAAATPCPRHL
mmetsp:Transcript_16487/g.33299  ORF Transcript_16487/g.33299 Transcript_16487/m.33299 type:complete len:215 (-) Transcript_16487:985-1629(-)